MAHVFTLTKMGEDRPTNIIDIDTMICEAVGDKVDKKLYCRGWYDIIGLALACGLSWNKIREDILGPASKLHPVLDYLEHNFIAKCYRTFA